MEDILILAKPVEQYSDKSGSGDSGDNIETFIGTDMRFEDPTNPDVVANDNNPNDYSYNSYADNRAPAYNMWSRVGSDICSVENRLRIGSKPMKYFVNDLNSPQSAPFMEFTIIGNQKAYDVRNEFERAIPSRLNPIYPTQVEPYLTTPFLGSANDDRLYADTSSNLRFGTDLRNRKSQNGTTEVDFNRFEPGVYGEVVQNAGQYQISPQEVVGPDGFYNYRYQNNVLFLNSAFSDVRFGVSTRDLLRNVSELGCTSR